jgi:hypothetical protein
MKPIISTVLLVWRVISHPEPQRHLSTKSSKRGVTFVT